MQAGYKNQVHGRTPGHAYDSDPGDCWPRSTFQWATWCTHQASPARRPVGMWPSQMADDRPSRPRETPDSPQPTAALWTAGYGMDERGSNEGWHRRRTHWDGLPSSPRP